MSTGMRGAHGGALGWDGARALSLRSREKEGAAERLERALGFRDPGRPENSPVSSRSRQGSPAGSERGTG